MHDTGKIQPPMLVRGERLRTPVANQRRLLTIMRMEQHPEPAVPVGILWVRPNGFKLLFDLGANLW